MAGHSTKQEPKQVEKHAEQQYAERGTETPGRRTGHPARHRRVRLSRRTTLALGGLAVSGLVLAPNVANADPKPTIEQVKAQLDTLYRQAADANEQYNAAQVAEQQLQTQIAGINTSIATDQAAMATAKQHLGTIAASQYRTGGGVDPTMQLLMQPDPQQVLDMASTVNRASANDADALTEVAQAKANLDAQSKAAASKLKELDKTTQDAAAKKKSFDDAVAQAQTTLNGLQAEQKAQLAALQAQQQAALQAQQAALQQQAQSASASPSGSASDSGSGSGSSTSGAGSTTSPTTPVPANSRAAAAVAFARAQLGKPYVFGATGPNAYDCSGLTQAAWAAAGVSIPRTATAQMQSLTPVSLSQAQPGDLVFFYGNASYVDHVGIYIGNGEVIHAPQPGSVVEVLPVSAMPFVSVGRP